MTQLAILPPGERLTLPLPPDGARHPLTADPTSNARMCLAAGVLYVAMRHGKRWPDDLSPCDRDRLHALGLLPDAQAWPDFADWVRDLAQRLAPLLLRSLPASVGVRVGVMVPSPALRVTVSAPGCPPLVLEAPERLCAEHVERVPSLCRLIVVAVRRRAGRL